MAKTKRVSKRTASKAKPAEEHLIQAALELLTINYKVEFHQGEGSIVFAGEGFPDGFHIDSKMPPDKWAFTVQQTRGKKFITVTGTAPAAPGKLTVEVSRDGNILSPASANTYNDLFNKIITYTV